ncbi:MAG: hypothetical protein ACOVN5_12095 [Aquidulcibacter sp.]
MSQTSSTNETNTKKRDFAIAIRKILDHWSEKQKGIEGGRREALFCKAFAITLINLQRWLDEKSAPQRQKWDDLRASLIKGKIDAELVAEADAVLRRPSKQPRNATAPDASSAGLQPPAPAPAPPGGTAPAPAPSALRFRVERRETVTPNPDQWFQLILHDAPQDAPNQLCFSIDYRPQTISLSRQGVAPLSFQVSLPAVRIMPGWEAVTALKDSINVNNASPTVTYRMGWEVILPQNANGMALDHFEAALLQARAAGDRLLLSAYARREDIAVTRIGNRPANGNRDRVIAQALRMLGFEGEGDHAEIATGAIVAEQDDKT